MRTINNQEKTRSLPLSPMPTCATNEKAKNNKRRHSPQQHPTHVQQPTHQNAGSSTWENLASWYSLAGKLSSRIRWTSDATKTHQPLVEQSPHLPSSQNEVFLPRSFRGIESNQTVTTFPDNLEIDDLTQELLQEQEEEESHPVQRSCEPILQRKAPQRDNVVLNLI